MEYRLFDQVISFFNPKFYKEKTWTKCYDQLLRIDGYSEDQILDIVRQFRSDGNWWKESGNFESLLKLRRTNREGIKYVDLFSIQIKKTEPTQRWIKR